MKAVSIVKYPAGILSSVCEEVDMPDFPLLNKWAWISKKANDLAGGYAVAAPQVGIQKRFFWYNVGGVSGLAVNPFITEWSDDIEVSREGCLSIPKKWFSVNRNRWVRWSWKDQSLNEHEAVWEGLMAHVVQHEIDHLNGVTLATK